MTALVTATETQAACGQTAPTDAPLPDLHAASDLAAGAAAPAHAGGTALCERRFDIDCRLEYEVQAPTHFMLQIEAVNGFGQRVESEALTIAPQVQLHRYEDERTGNRFVRFDVLPGPLCIDYRASVALQPVEAEPDLPEWPISRLPDDVMRYLMPTRYCESDHLARAALKLFGGIPPGRGRVERICDWIHENIEYKPGSTDATTAARDVYLNHAGVCRDFAHLGITFCRALNIPARLVVGYVKFDTPPQDFHAIFEAWLGGRWVLFDPTKLAPPERLVRIATGRDAKDVAFATLFGPAMMVSMSPQVEEVAQVAEEAVAA